MHIDIFSKNVLVLIIIIPRVTANEEVSQKEKKKIAYIWIKMLRKNNGLFDVLNLLFLAAYCGQCLVNVFSGLEQMVIWLK